MTGYGRVADTSADVRLRAVLDTPEGAGFNVVAGAGSGKTTSLVKALQHVLTSREAELRATARRIGCITYTDGAVDVIHRAVSNSPAVHVATIHSFLWDVIEPFSATVGEWLRGRLATKIAKAKTDDDRSRYERQLHALRDVRRFTCGIAPDHGRGQIGSSDILQMVPELIRTRPLLADLIAARYPVLLVDESQDTTKDVVEALMQVQQLAATPMTLGFFGDPMQKIYAGGIGAIPAPPNWCTITKPENFRSSRRVLDVVNQIRLAGGYEAQTPGRAVTPQGSVFFFVLPADADPGTSTAQVRRWLAAATTHDSWVDDSPEGAKILVPLHRMAATRLGFAGLYSAFHDHQHRSASLTDGFLDGTAWPILPFIKVIAPLNDPRVDDFAVLQTVRQYGTVLSDTPGRPQIGRADLAAARVAVEETRKLWADGGGGSVGVVLRIAYERGLIDPVPKLARYLDPHGPHSDQVLKDVEVATLDAFVACDVREIEGYLTYVQKESPYATQHSTKGDEYRHVLVLINDAEGALPAISYNKLFAQREPSATDRANALAGRETTVDRSRRLFYVSASRAREQLAVVVYADDVDAAVRSLTHDGITAGETIHTLHDLAKTGGVGADDRAPLDRCP